jgi:hypothetical protein
MYMLLRTFSDPAEVKRRAKEYLGSDIEIRPSTRKDKKYMVKKPNNGFVHFGQMGYEDFTKHKDPDRRENYLKRTAGIAGNWRKDKFSPNNLSRNLLWSA